MSVIEPNHSDPPFPCRLLYGRDRQPIKQQQSGQTARVFWVDLQSDRPFAAMFSSDRSQTERMRLDQTIHNRLLQVPGTRDRAVRQARFYVLRKTSMPAVLIEVSFVTEKQDAARLASPVYRHQLSAARARGILQYLQADP